MPEFLNSFTCPRVFNRWKLGIYEAFIEGGLTAPRYLAGVVHGLYFNPKYQGVPASDHVELSNAFTSAFKELDPIPQFKATAKLGAFLKTVQTD